jgi:hypothetical protein
MSKEKYIPEGLSCTRPPFFNGKNYYFWKGKMELFLRSQDVDMWKIITNGNHVPMTTDATTKVETITPEASWSKEDKEKILLNSKARLFLSCALSMEESERVDECDTAKKVWDTLKIHHEGTSHVKETRIDIGVRKFEIFEMNEDENIDEMYSRFTSIVNELRSLGKTYTTHDRIRKILRCLPSTWRPMVTAITQAKDLNSLALEDLIGSLKAHETLLQDDKPSRKGKMVALKASQSEQEDAITQSEGIKESNEEENIQGEAEDELALITKKIQRMMRRRDQIKKYFPNKKDNSKGEIDKSQVTCFGCNKLGHYKNECPLNKKTQKKSPYSKSMFTWDDLEEPKDEDTEANMVLMANSENEEVILFDQPQVYKELENKFDSLLFDSNFLTNKCHSLQKEISDLKEEKEKLQTLNNDQKKTIQSLQDSYFQATEKIKAFGKTKLPENSRNENIVLKREVKELRNDLSQFIKSTETFQKIVGSQMAEFDKTGLGFNQIYEKCLIPQKLKCSFCKKQGHHESICFHKKRKQEIKVDQTISEHSQEHSSSVKRKECSYCKRLGHLEVNCFLKIKHLEICEANQKGPTSSWVPKEPLTQNAGILTRCKNKAMVLGQWLF